MPPSVVPMIHVPDVRAAADWYRRLGFTVDNTFEDDDDGMTWASLSFGTTNIMFNAGGGPSSAERREVDLYVNTEDVDALYQRLRAEVEVVQEPMNTFYGTREFIIRDLNRFWITFGQPAG